MHTDRKLPALSRIIDDDAPLDQIAQGLSFGEGPVWNKRTQELFWVNIVGWFKFNNRIKLIVFVTATN
jgi:sugar lactone lactonase YvrE